MALSFDLLLTNFDSITEIRVYRSVGTPLDINALGDPFQVLPKGSKTIIDDTIEFGQTAQYMAESVFSDGTTRRSGIVEATYGETIVCATNNNQLHMINFDGLKFDGFSIQSASSFYVDTDANGDVYLYNSSSRAEKYDKFGALVWQNTTPSGAGVSVCYDNVNNHFVILTSARNIYALNAETGDVVWSKLTTHSTTVYEVFVDNMGNVVTCGNDYYTRCFDGLTGDLVWEYLELDTSNRINHVVCDTDNIFFVATANGNVRKLNVQGHLSEATEYSFDESWSLNLGVEAECVTIHHALPDYVYANTHYEVFKINKTTGAIVSQFTMPDSTHNIRVTEKECFVLNHSNNRSLYMYAPDGQLRWSDNTFSTNYVYDFVFVPGKQSTVYGMHTRS